MVSACRALGVSVEIRIQGKVIPLVHAIDPLERREIEANLDWFSHLSPLDRLRTMRRQYFGLMKLRQAAMSAASSAGHGA